MRANAPVIDRSSSTTSIVLGGWAFTLMFLSRQADANLSPFTEPALDCNFAAVFFNDFFSVRHAKAQAAGLIGIERFENLFDSFFGHSGAGIFYNQRERFSVDPGGDTQSPAGRHRLNRIEQKIQQGCADATFVEQRRWVFITLLKLYLDPVRGYL